MGKNYGLPYMGSKNKIAEWVVAHIPQADTLVDLFAGGCAVTDCAMRTKKWRNFIVNDIGDAPCLFADAVAGRYADERRWISREDFARLKDTDPYVRICWSFGNNQKDYLYSREVEPWKKALHYARVLGDYSLLREFGIDTDRADRETVKKNERAWKVLYIRWYCSEVPFERLQRLESLEILQRLQSLECLQRLQSLQRLERLQSLQQSYDEVEIPQDCVVYCDPPYKGTSGYTVEFDHQRFYDWIKRQTVPIIISEYDMPSEFPVIAERPHRSRLSATSNNFVMERLYGWNVTSRPKYFQFSLF